MFPDAGSSTSQLGLPYFRCYVYIYTHIICFCYLILSFISCFLLTFWEGDHICIYIYRYTHIICFCYLILSFISCFLLTFWEGDHICIYTYTYHMLLLFDIVFHFMFLTYFLGGGPHMSIYIYVERERERFTEADKNLQTASIRCLSAQRREASDGSRSSSSSA